MNRPADYERNERRPSPARNRPRFGCAVSPRHGTARRWEGEVLRPGVEYPPTHPAVIAHPEWFVVAASVELAEAVARNVAEARAAEAMQHPAETADPQGGDEGKIEYHE